MNETIIDIVGLTKEYESFKKEPGLLGAVKSLFKKNVYKVQAVRSLNLTVIKGEFIGFIGPNGAGKTTTLKMMSGILHPTTGEITVAGFTPIKRQKEFLNKCALVMGQKNQLWWDLPALDSYELLKTIYSIPQKKFDENLKFLTDLLKVKETIGVAVRKMSLGERMKCELLGALLHDPEILFLDEPTIGLDIISQESIRHFLKKYNKEKKATIILTSHYMEDIKKLCDRMVIINRGEIVFDNKYEVFTKEFMKSKIVEIELEKEIAKEVLEKFGQLIEKEGNKVKLIIPTNNLINVVENLLQKFTVSNISIHEEPLEDIVKKFY